MTAKRYTLANPYRAASRIETPEADCRRVQVQFKAMDDHGRWMKGTRIRSILVNCRSVVELADAFTAALVDPCPREERNTVDKRVERA